MPVFPPAASKTVITSRKSSTRLPAMVDAEAPTAPSSPMLSSSTLFLPRQSALYSPVSPDPTQTTAATQQVTPKAAIPRCAICWRTLLKFPKEASVNHVNKCWEGLRSAAQTSKADAEQVAQAALHESSAVIGVHRLTHGALARHQKLEEWQEDGVSIGNSSSWSSKGQASLDNESVKTQSSSSGSSEVAVAPWECVLCRKDLFYHDAVDALNHRSICRSLVAPYQCPICQEELVSLFIHEPLGHYAVLKHLQKCQNGISLVHFEINNFEVDNFEATSEALEGRLYSVGRRLRHNIGPRRTWTHREYKRSFKAKKEKDLENDDNLYSAGASPLRRVTQIIEKSGQLQVVHYRRLITQPRFQMERFRRSSSVVTAISPKFRYRDLPSYRWEQRSSQLLIEEEVEQETGRQRGRLTMTDKQRIAAFEARFSAARKPVVLGLTSHARKESRASQSSGPPLHRRHPELLAPLPGLRDALLAPLEVAARQTPVRQWSALQSPSVVLPRRVRKFPDVVFTCPCELGN